MPVPGKADARAIPKATGERQGARGENRGRPEWRLLGKECTEMLDGGEPNCVPPGTLISAYVVACRLPLRLDQLQKRVNGQNHENPSGNLPVVSRKIPW
jgi:hypothetical protein